MVDIMASIYLDEQGHMHECWMDMLMEQVDFHRSALYFNVPRTGHTSWPVNGAGRLP